MEADPFFDEHVAPQAAFLAALPRLDFVVPLGRASDEYGACLSNATGGALSALLPRLNEREGGDRAPRSWTRLSADARRRVCAAYAADYECFGCAASSWEALCADEGGG